jgi:hypothetical protein
MTCSTLIKTTIATASTALTLLIAEASFLPAHATQQFFCTGRMSNGWGYTAEFVNGRFTQIRWQQSGQPPQVSQLSFSTTNAEGHPVYRGAFQAATAVTLVDLSAGDVRTGSQISVGVEEWGWSRGTCSLSSSGGSSSSVDSVRQSLVGVGQDQAWKWLRQNNYVFVQTMEHTDRRVVERYQDTNKSFDMIIVDGIVSDVVQAR